MTPTDKNGVIIPLPAKKVNSCIGSFPANSLEAALTLAKQHLGKEDIKIAGIPDVVSGIVRKN